VSKCELFLTTLLGVYGHPKYEQSCLLKILGKPEDHGIISKLLRKK